MRNEEGATWAPQLCKHLGAEVHYIGAKWLGYPQCTQTRKLYSDQHDGHYTRLFRPTLLALSRDEHVLLLEQLAQRAVLVHRHENVSAANELVGDVKLGNGLPVAVLLDTCPTHVSTSLNWPSSTSRALPEFQRTRSKVLILQHIECSELLRVDALQAEDLDRGARETALRRLRRALHEQHHGRRGDGLVDC